MSTGTVDRLSELRIGQTEVVSQEVTARDVAAFAELSGDFNALHIDPEYAARTEFVRPVAHGFLHASMLSRLVGMKLPGRGALYLSQTIEFSAPVFVGDRLEARGTVEKIDLETRLVVIETEITNQNGVRVLHGKAKAKVLRVIADIAPKSCGHVLSSSMLAGKSALVTGASRGIGRATARLLAAHGANVCVNYLNSEQAAVSLRDEILAAGGLCRIVRADLTSPADVESLVERAAATGPLDILVNNAGPKIHSAPFARLNWSEMQAAYDAIVGAAFAVTKASLPHLRVGQGRIINVLSSAALGRTAYNWLPYVAAKAALHAMSKNLAQELGPTGMTVNTISPSMINTDLVSETPERIRQAHIARTPLRRLATVDDVAGAILMLASPFAQFITGDNLLVTGGDIMS